MKRLVLPGFVVGVLLALASTARAQCPGGTCPSPAASRWALPRQAMPQPAIRYTPAPVAVQYPYATAYPVAPAYRPAAPVYSYTYAYPAPAYRSTVAAPTYFASPCASGRCPAPAR